MKIQAGTKSQARKKYYYPVTSYGPVVRAILRRRHRERARRDRDRLRAAGLCVQCRKPRDDEKLTWRCSSCQARVRHNRNGGA